jgi:hypothetical protein
LASVTPVTDEGKFSELADEQLAIASPLSVSDWCDSVVSFWLSVLTKSGPPPLDGLGELGFLGGWGESGSVGLSGGVKVEKKR